MKSEETLELIEHLKLENERLSSEKNEQAKQIELLQEQVNDLLRRLYSPKRERFEHPDQTDLLELIGWTPDAPSASAEKPEDVEKIEYMRKRPKKFGPKPLPENLPRVVVEIDPAEEELVCACCKSEMERVGETVTEELDVIPQQFRVKQYVQGKYRCRGCMNRDVVKPLPPRPIAKGRPSPTLLAYLIVSKYADHLPLHRQEQIFKRSGIHLARSTMDEWLGQLSGLLLPIVNAMKRRLLRFTYLQCDETPHKALLHEERGKKKREKNKKKKPKNNSKQIRGCYLWTYTRPQSEIVYDVTGSRSSRGPKEFLGDFEGYLQTDGYVGYNEIYRSGRVRHVACMAHIRRKFYDQRHALPERLDEILELIRSLYAVERHCRDEGLSREARRELRLEKARPVFDRLKSRIDDLAPIPTPGSKLGKAVKYAQGQWRSMERYYESGELEIDNNICENAIRPTVLGRKNHLFLGSLEGGGKRVKAFYSLVQSCKRLEIDPFHYLADVIDRIATHPESRIDELTPRRWKEAAEKAGNPAASTGR